MARTPTVGRRKTLTVSPCIMTGVGDTRHEVAMSPGRTWGWLLVVRFWAEMRS